MATFFVSWGSSGVSMSQVTAAKKDAEAAADEAIRARATQHVVVWQSVGVSMQGFYLSWKTSMVILVGLSRESFDYDTGNLHFEHSP